jgi:hypothetical protein
MNLGAAASLDQLVRYSYDRDSNLAMKALACLGKANTGVIGELEVASLNCLVNYLTPDAIARLDSSGLTRSLSCFGKTVKMNDAGVTVMPVLKPTTVTAVCNKIKTLKG